MIKVSILIEFSPDPETLLAEIEEAVANGNWTLAEELIHEYVEGK